MKKDHKAKHYVLAVVLIVVAVLLDQYTKYLNLPTWKTEGRRSGFFRTGSSFLYVSLL